MSYEIIDDFLDQESFEKIQRVMTGRDDFNHSPFHWYLSNAVAYDSKETDDTYYFIHSFYRDFYPESEWFQELLPPLCTKMPIRALMRVKGNLYPGTDNLKEHDWHVDKDFLHAGAIFYVNTNNGYTRLQDGTKIESIANRILFFDASQPHHSTTCTDEKFRVTINFNYF